MTSDITPYRKSTGGGFWFTERTAQAVVPFFTRPKNWPHGYARLARATIDYSRLNNLRSQISRVSCLTNPHELSKGIKIVHSMAQALCWQSKILRGHLEQLTAWLKDSSKMEPEKVANVKRVLRTLVEDVYWVQEMSVSIAAWLLLSIATFVCDAGPIVQMVKQTCHRIVPTMGTTYHVPMDKRMGRSQFLSFPSFPSDAFDPSRHPMPPGQISDLDHVMQAFIQLLPQLLPKDVGPILALYLSKRGDYDALHFVIPRGFRLGHASECLITMLGPNSQHEHILLALSALVVLPEYPLTEWEDYDERLWKYLAEADVFNVQAFTTLCSVMTMRKYGSISGIAHSKCPNLLELSNHVLLPERVGPALAAVTPEDMLCDIKIRVTQSKIVAVTDYLFKCLQAGSRPVDMRNGAEALISLLTGPVNCVDIKVLVDFGQAWHAVVHYLSEHPTDDDLRFVLHLVFQWAKNYAKLLCDVPVAALLTFKEAVLLYSRFPETRDSSGSAEGEPAVEQAKQVLAAFTSYCMEDTGE
ncbi:hypothetical protein C8R47DRAFT_1159292 [Mycena vitilis]|nr:hypothetical protein C8R47DRAFT_1159292 [Mycena vitilis]